MLPPHELKNKTFSRVLRGYNSVEVDEHINFIIDKYTELYRQNDELERKLKLAEAQLDEFRADEESIRSALVNAQKASAKIIGEANDRADVIMRSAKTNCDKVIVNFRADLQKQRDQLLILRRTVAEFKASLFAQYQQHITYIEEISPDEEESDADTSDEVFIRRVVNQVKNDIATGKVAVNTTPDDEPIITYTQPAKDEPKPQPAIREITRRQPEPESEPKPAEPERPQPEPQASVFDEVIATDKSSAKNIVTDVKSDAADNDEEDGGGYLDDEDVKAAEPKTGNTLKYADADDEPDTELFGSVKPNSRPSTIATSTAKISPIETASSKAAAAASSTIAQSSINAVENSETGEIIQAGRQKAPQNSFRSTSVKDTIRELNRKFSSEETDTDPTAEQDAKKSPRQESYAPDAEDEELLSMIRNVTGAAEEKDKTGNKYKKKNKTKPLTLTEEFDLISEDEANTNKK